MLENGVFNVDVVNGAIPLRFGPKIATNRRIVLNVNQLYLFDEKLFKL